MQPSIETERLVLRPFRLEDGPVVRELAGDPAVADTTLNVPHPYGEGVAEAWIATHPERWDRLEVATFALTTAGDGVIGAMSLSMSVEHRRAELGYWVGQRHWNRGYATEAVRALIPFGFRALPIDRIFAQHFARNPASGRVLVKAGMRYEGMMRQHVRRFDRPEDCVQYGILRSDLAG